MISQFKAGHPIDFWYQMKTYEQYVNGRFREISGNNMIVLDYHTGKEKKFDLDRISGARLVN